MSNIQEFNLILEDIVNNKTVLQMKNYFQHCSTTCYDHCLNVSYYSFLLCKKLHLDYKSAARAAMLHDLFLYDWRKKINRKGLHAFTHSKTSLKNSLEIFELNNKEKDIILKHMWPVTVSFPKYAESFIVTLMDKFCALKETFTYFKNNIRFQKSLRFVNMFLFIFLIQF